MSLQLTPKQRRSILEREHPHIPLDVKEVPDVVAGEVIVLKEHRVWVTILGVGKAKDKGLYLRYSVRDDRPRLIRRVPHRVDYAAIRASYDQYGEPKAVSEQTGDEAEEESGYTTSEALAIDDAGEAVPVEYQNELTMRARTRRMENLSEERATELAKRQARQINEAIRESLLQRTRLGLRPDSEGMTELYRAMEKLKTENEQAKEAA